MKLLVFGAGAIGTYIGGSLALTGHSVSFTEQPKETEELQKRGLRLELFGNQSSVTSDQYSVQFTASLRDTLESGPFDVAIFALKSFDTSAALEGMKPYIDQMPPVLCLQNGVDNEFCYQDRPGRKQSDRWHGHIVHRPPRRRGYCARAMAWGWGGGGPSIIREAGCCAG